MRIASGFEIITTVIGCLDRHERVSMDRPYLEARVLVPVAVVSFALAVGAHGYASTYATVASAAFSLTGSLALALAITKTASAREQTLIPRTTSHQQFQASGESRPPHATRFQTGRSKAIIQRHLLGIHFLATFAFSWLFWVPALILFRGQLQGQTSVAHFPVGFVALQTLGAAGPSVVAVALVRLVYGRKGLSALKERFWRWRASLRWFLAAALVIPAITVTSIAARSLLDPSFSIPSRSPLGTMLGDIGVVGTILVSPLMFVGFLFTSPVLEELGWRGFALPRLQQHFGALSAGILLGVVWGLWHLPLWLANGETVPLSLLLIVAHSIILTWLFNSARGSLLVAMFAHGSANFSFLVLDVGQSRIIELGIAWLVVMYIILRYGSKNLCTPERFQWAGYEFGDRQPRVDDSQSSAVPDGKPTPEMG